MKNLRVTNKINNKINQFLAWNFIHPTSFQWSLENKIKTKNLENDEKEKGARGGGGGVNFGNIYKLTFF